MKKLLLIAVFLAATAFSGPVGASEISQASLQGLLARSGIQDLVKQFPGLLRMRMERARQRERFIPNQPSLSDEDYQQLEKVVLNAFKPAGLLKVVGDAVRKSVSEQDARKMLAWYDSDLGKAFSRAEQLSSTVEAARDMYASQKALLAKRERVLFAMKLDKLLHMTDMSMQFQNDAAVAIFVAFSTKKNAHRPTNIKALRKRIAAGMKKKRYRVRHSVILSTVYTYRHLDIKDLRKYRAFLESPAALRFNRALMAGIDAGMNQATDRMARAVETLMKKSRLQSA